MSKSVPVVDVANLTPETFWKDYVSQRQAVRIRGHFTDATWTASARWTLPYLKEQAGDSAVIIESRDPTTRRFGAGIRKRSSFGAFLDQVAAGDSSVYLSSCEPPIHPEDDRPEVLAPPLSSVDLRKDFPLRPEIAGHLIPQQINLWMGASSKEGSSSGLHHDFHDNIYVLLHGRKRFRILPPEEIRRLYTYGKPEKVYDNGRIVYEGQGDVLEDGAEASEVKLWRRRYQAEREVAAAEADVTMGITSGPSRLKAALAKLDKVEEAELEELLDEEDEDEDEDEDDEENIIDIIGKAEIKGKKVAALNVEDLRSDDDDEGGEDEEGESDEDEEGEDEEEDETEEDSEDADTDIESMDEDEINNAGMSDGEGEELEKSDNENEDKEDEEEEKIIQRSKGKAKEAASSSTTPKANKVSAIVASSKTKSPKATLSKTDSALKVLRTSSESGSTVSEAPTPFNRKSATTPSKSTPISKALAPSPSKPAAVVAPATPKTSTTPKAAATLKTPTVPEPPATPDVAVASSLTVPEISVKSVSVTTPSVSSSKSKDLEPTTPLSSKKKAKKQNSNPSTPLVSSSLSITPMNASDSSADVATSFSNSAPITSTPISATPSSSSAAVASTPKASTITTPVSSRKSMAPPSTPRPMILTPSKKQPPPPLGTPQKAPPSSLSKAAKPLPSTLNTHVNPSSASKAMALPKVAAATTAATTAATSAATSALLSTPSFRTASKAAAPPKSVVADSTPIKSKAPNAALNPSTPSKATPSKATTSADKPQMETPVKTPAKTPAKNPAKTPTKTPVKKTNNTASIIHNPTATAAAVPSTPTTESKAKKRPASAIEKEGNGGGHMPTSSSKKPDSASKFPRFKF